MSRRTAPAVRTAVALLGLLLLTPGIGRTDRKKTYVDPLLRRMIRSDAAARAKDGPRGRIKQEELKQYGRMMAFDSEAAEPAVRVRMKLDAQARHDIKRLGIAVYGSLDGFGSALVPVSRLSEVESIPGVETMQAMRRPKLELDASRTDVRSNLVATTYNGKGRGVIIGSVDTGIDWHNPDFRNADGTTRIKYLWSQDDACGAGPLPPPPFNFGCLFTEADINAALTGGPTITAPDAEGHGTHTMGVAAGNGRNTGNGFFPAGTFTGMAPEADLIIVKTFPEPTDVSDCPTCFDISAGLEFIDSMAGSLGRPYSINLSLGSQFGGHDGSDLDEQTIDSLTGNGHPGKVISKSAGNERGHRIHIGGVVLTNQTNSHTFTIPTYTSNPGTFNDIVAWQVWYAGGDRLTVTIADPTTAPCTGTPTVSLSTGGGQAFLPSTNGDLLIDDTSSPAPNGARFFDMEIDDQSAATHLPCRGTWTLRVHGDTITESGQYDAWIWYSSMADVNGVDTQWTTLDNTRNISVPGTAFNTTTVGAYMTKYSWTSIDNGTYHFTGTVATDVGKIANFSSAGPSRDGRLKPEINAPGTAIVSALSQDVDASPTGGNQPLVVKDGAHWALPGTSFSSPHVAGIYAQLLSVNPNLDAIDLRTLLTKTGRVDVNVTPVPNNDWGWGKADAKAAADLMVKPIPDLSANTTNTQFTWTSLGVGNTYNVYRGDVLLRSLTYYGSCFATALPTATFTDNATPAVDGGFFYYVTAVKDGVEGMLGFRSDGTPRPNLAACP